MKFCKKCHKIIIKNVHTLKDFDNMCRCNEDEMVHLVNGSGVMGFVNVAMSNKKRDGTKRKIAKDINIDKDIN